MQAIVLAVDGPLLAARADGTTSSAWSAFAGFQIGVWGTVVVSHWLVYFLLRSRDKDEFKTRLYNSAQYCYLAVGALHAFVSAFSPDRVLAMLTPGLPSEIAAAADALPSGSADLLWGVPNANASSAVAFLSPWGAQAGAWMAANYPTTASVLSADELRCPGYAPPLASLGYTRSICQISGGSEALPLLLLCIHAFHLAVYSRVKPVTFLFYMHIAVLWYLICRGAFGSLDSRPYFYWLDALLLYVLLAVAALCALRADVARRQRFLYDLRYKMMNRTSADTSKAIQSLEKREEQHRQEIIFISNAFEELGTEMDSIRHHEKGSGGSGSGLAGGLSSISQAIVGFEAAASHLLHLPHDHSGGSFVSKRLSFRGGREKTSRVPGERTRRGSRRTIEKLGDVLHKVSSALGHHSDDEKVEAGAAAQQREEVGAAAVDVSVAAADPAPAAEPAAAASVTFATPSGRSQSDRGPRERRQPSLNRGGNAPDITLAPEAIKVTNLNTTPSVMKRAKTGGWGMIRSLAPSAAMSAADPEHSLHRNSVSAVVETAMMKESPRGLGASPRRGLLNNIMPSLASAAASTTTTFEQLEEKQLYLPEPLSTAILRHRTDDDEHIAGFQVRQLLQWVDRGKDAAEERMVKLRQAANSIRDPSYRLDHFLTDMVDIFPELNLYYVYDPPADTPTGASEAAAPSAARQTSSGRTSSDEYKRTIGALFAIYWLMRIDENDVGMCHITKREQGAEASGDPFAAEPPTPATPSDPDLMWPSSYAPPILDGQRGFCFGVGNGWVPPSTAYCRRRYRQLQKLKEEDEAKYDEATRKKQQIEAKRLAFLLQMDWGHLRDLFLDAGILLRDSSTGKLAVDTERTVAMLALTAIHDIMKIEAMLPTVSKEHAPYLGYKEGEKINDHDAALGYVLEYDVEAFPSFDMLPEAHQNSIRFTQAKLGFNHGWLVQAEAPPGALFSQFKSEIERGGVTTNDGKNTHLTQHHLSL